MKIEVNRTWKKIALKKNSLEHQFVIQIQFLFEKKTNFKLNHFFAPFFTPAWLKLKL